MPAEVVQPQVFRSTFWRGVALIWVPIVAFVLWDVSRLGFPSSGWSALAVIGALTVLVYAVGWRPAVVAGQDAVVVRNPFRTATIPWGAVTDIDVTDALRVHTADSVTRAWSVDRGGALANTMRGMGSRRMSSHRGVEQAAMVEMARRSPADFTLAALTEIWRQRRGQVRGTRHIAWAWPVIGALLALTATSVALIAT